MHATFRSLSLSFTQDRKQYVYVRATNKLFIFIAAKDSVPLNSVQRFFILDQIEANKARDSIKIHQTK